MAEQKQNAIAVRCHQVGGIEKNLYLYLQEYFGKENTFFVINTDSSEAKCPDGFNSVVFNHDVILSSQELLWGDNTGWKCGDYSYYALWHALSGYEYFWLVEPDVKFCSEKASDFFSEFESQNIGFIAPMFGKANTNLPFYASARYLEAEPMSCLFPITRMKCTNIGAFFGTRKKLSEKFMKERIPEHLYPNDEIFIATVAMRLGIGCAPMNKLSSFDFAMFFSNEKAFLDEDVSGVKGKFMMHPVLDKTSYVNKSIGKYQKLFNDSYELLDFMNQTIKKCSNASVKKEFRERLKKDFESFVNGID